jgi:hypothetical protein
VPLVALDRLADARSGDKGDSSNVGVLAHDREIYAWLQENVTTEWVKRALGGFVRGPVERFEVPNVLGLNFILHDSLGGGGSSSLLTDAQGKTHAQALLRCRIEVPEELLARIEANEGRRG